MMQQNLFNVKPVKIEAGKRCKNCIYCDEHQYNSTKYCSKQFSRRTSYGNKKIKANDPACPMFEAIKKFN